MKRLTALPCVLATLIVVAGASAQQSTMVVASAPEDAGISSAHLDRAARLLDRFVAEHRIAGAVAGIARHGKVAYLGAVGLQDIASGSPMTPGSIFRIYSMTKPVTAVAVMMLHEEGRFDLDDPVSRYLPEFANLQVADDGATRPPRRPVTVRDLLLHTSGLNHRTSALYREEQVRSRSVPLDRFITDIARVPLMEDPGTRHRYSESPTVLGKLVEVWSGQPLDEFLQLRIFDPLGMVDTGFQVARADLGRLATVYAPVDGGGLEPIEVEELPFTEVPALIEGAVGLVSTVPDYLRFGQMLLNGGHLDGIRILQAETVGMITRNGLPEDVLEIRGGNFGWGLGNVNVLLEDDGAGYPANAGEYGWSGSAGTIFWIDPVDDTVIVLMTQVSPANPDRLQTQFRTIVVEGLLN